MSPFTASPSSDDDGWVGVWSGRGSSTPSASGGSAASAAGGLGSATASSTSTTGVLDVFTGRHVDTSVVVDAPSRVLLTQGAVAQHRATGPVDVVQLLAASVAPDTSQVAPGQLVESLAAATTLGDLLPAGDLGSRSALSSATTSSPTASDVLLLAATAGAALALAGTAWEGARRQRVRVSVSRGHGRRARR